MLIARQEASRHQLMTQTITARRLFTDIGSVEFAVIEVSPAGLITDIYSDPKALHHETSTLTAAFLDIHTHGAMGHDVMAPSPTGLSAMQRFLAAHGTAHYLPTTATAPIDDTLRALERLADAIERETPGDEARPIGIHLEGPFLSHTRRGMHPPELLQPPSIALFDRFFAAARGHISLMTIAPEPNAATNPATNPGGPSFAPYAKGGVSSEARPSSSAPGTHSRPERNANAAFATDLGTNRYPEALASGLTAPQKEGLQPRGPAFAEASPALDLIRHATSLGVRISLGHTNATAAETLAAIDAGATSATHTFNAMRPLDHREPGILGTLLTDDRLYAELICDGVHVAPALVRLWLRSKGPTHAILVTDAMEAAGMPDGSYALAGTAVRVENGRVLLQSDLAQGKETLAGSILTMDTAVANVRSFTGASLPDATRLASHNPAAMLGQPELTRLAPGSPASFNRFDAAGKLVATYINGHEVFEPA